MALNADQGSGFCRPPGDVPRVGFSLRSRIDRYFDLAGKGSSFATETIAGVSTFLALSYIFIVNPAILAQAGMNRSAVLFATILTSALATLAMGLWARLPFVLAPGMEMNAYVAFFVVGTLGFTWQEALGAVFWSGVLFVLLTVTRVREKIIQSIPEGMKSGLSLSVGTFLAIVALKTAGILKYQGIRFTGFGNLRSYAALVVFCSLVLILILERLRVRGAVLISILATALLCHLLHIVDISGGSSNLQGIFAAAGKLDVSIIFQPKMLNVILTLFLIDFYGSVAKLIGLSMNTNIAIDRRVPRLREALLIDGLATTVGSGVGTSSLTVYVESGVGIGAGGRTGLTAVVCAILMLACFAFGPLLAYIPVLAASGALLWVAIQLCPSIENLRQMKPADKAALVLMQLMVLGTFTLNYAMLIGYGVYIVRDFRLKQINGYAFGSFLLLGVGAVIQITYG